MPIGFSVPSFMFSIDLARGPKPLLDGLLLVSDPGGRGEVVVILDIENPHFSWTEPEEELGDGRG